MRGNLWIYDRAADRMRRARCDMHRDPSGFNWRTLRVALQAAMRMAS